MGSDAHAASDPVFFSKHFKIENMRGRRAVILGLSFAVIGGKRDKAHRFCFDVQKMLYKASVIVGHFDRGRPIAVFVHKLDFIMLNKAFREAEGRIPIAFWEKQRGRGVQCVGVSVGIFAVKVAVEDEPNAAYARWRIKSIGDRLIRLSEIAVVVSENAAVDTVQKRAGIAVIRTQYGALRKLRYLPLKARKKTVVVH